MWIVVRSIVNYKKIRELRLDHSNKKIMNEIIIVCSKNINEKLNFEILS